MSGVVTKIVRSQLRDATRSRWLAVYALFFVLLSDGLLRFSGSDAKAVISLATVVLIVIPLVTLVLSTIYVYNAREFTELLLAQPIRRSSLFAGLYLGLTIPLAGGFVVGVALPFMARGGGDPAQRGALLTLLAIGVVLTAAFTAIAFWIALRAEDRLRGLGMALGVWLLLGLLYDGAVLVVVAIFADYPIERPLLALTFANPIDLGRMLMLLRLDVAALMGYTGAVFQRFFAGTTGIALASAALAGWVLVPLALSARLFRRKDF
ncbi:MAG TPA: ABC transporter permease subunit [Gemmatimonadaceae bacterium]|nr:ABC transporter permease subunit [Gemmatimonadaceae bacterium]